MIQKVTEAIYGKKPLQNASIMEVMKILILAWADVTPKTDKNCFKKTGFSEIKEDDGIHECDDLFTALKDSIKQLGLLDENSKNLFVDDVDEYVKPRVKQDIFLLVPHNERFG